MNRAGCGICRFIENSQDSKQKDRIILALSSEYKSSARAVTELKNNGLETSTRSIRRHRLEQDQTLTSSSNKNSSPAQQLPKGWEEYSEYNETIGKAAKFLPTPNNTHRDLLVASGFNPDEWQIDGPVNTRKWQRYDHEWLYYYKFNVKAGESPEVVQQHVDELVDVIRKRKKAAGFIKPATDAFVFAASDWQIGKREGNDGTPQTIERVLTSIEMAEARIKSLRKQGFKMPSLLFAGLGDLGEGTCGFYPGQQFLIDRNRREQGRINRELITTALDTLTPYFDETTVAVVGGNHGENRSPEGKRITNDGDNDDCAYFDAVREAFDRSHRTDIAWDIMDEELSMALTVGGVSIGLTHGHLGLKGATAQQRAYEWWKNQDFGFNAVRGTRILLSAHYHHFSATTFGARTHLQTPAMDPGSKWFREATGQNSPPGTLTFRLDANHPLGWDDISVLSPLKGVLNG